MYIIIAILIPFTLIYVIYWIVAMKNPFITILIVGKKGGGKSTDATAKCIENHDKKFIYYDKDEKFFNRFKIAKWNIVTNFKVNVDFPVQKIDIKKLGDYIPKPFSYILLDEINLVWDNRNFKQFKESTQEFFRLCRKLRCKVVMYSQTFDCDKKIRDLTDQMWLYQNKLGIFCYGKKISKVPDIKESAMNAESQLVDVIKFESILVPGSRRLLFIPKYIKYFDSYENLNNKPYFPEEYWPIKKKGVPAAYGKLNKRKILDVFNFRRQHKEKSTLVNEVT